MQNNFDGNDRIRIQSAIKEKGELIFRSMEGESSSIFNKDWWYGRIMDWSMKNDHFKTQMFRFVDVLPHLHTGSEVTRHLKEYFIPHEGDELPSVFNIGLGVGSLAPSLLSGAVRKNVTQMAKMFITGETPEEALVVLKKSRKNNLCFTVDLLGEATLSEKEAAEYQNRYQDLMSRLSQEAIHWADHPLLDQNDLGPLPKVNISVKLTALYSQVSTRAWDLSVRTLKDRLRPLFQMAREKNVFLNLDMEQHDYKDLTLQVFRELIMEPDFKHYPFWGIVIQAYLRESFEDVKQLIRFAGQRGVPFTIRLVKGAYWDHETIVARQRNWPLPVFLNKKETDYNFEQCLGLLLKSHPSLWVAIASHNVRSLATGMVMAERLGLDPKAIELQMLYGMAEPIKRACVKLGYRVREYATVGELIPGMAYLVRRLLENTSNESFLRSQFSEGFSSDVLLEDPAEKMVVTEGQISRSEGFYNEPLINFNESSQREKLIQTLNRINLKAHQESTALPLIVNNQKILTENYLFSQNPSHPEQVLGRICQASPKEVELAVEGAQKAQIQWSRREIKDRAQVLERLADLMTRDRMELMALEIEEVGKSWVEADGDVAEAIDFCRYYAKEMIRLGLPRRVGHAPGEISHYHYWPRGVVAVIAPWNFPLAILTGMVSAALVTGNTVVMKPAEQSSLVAAHLMKLIMELNLPPGVVQFLPGSGEEVGARLVDHPGVDLIAFTGSKAVGLEILSRASRVSQGQKGIKKCLIEMGGKNAIIVDSDADLDEAVAGVIHSAFGFQGQKCSACSRVIVLESIYQRFVDRLIAAAESIPCGDPQNPEVILGPVIDQEAQKRILAIIEKARIESRILFQGKVPQKGFFVPPTIFGEVKENSLLAQEEIFGPVLAVFSVPDLKTAIAWANNTEYGLTGGVYSRSPSHIETVKNELMVGNLYINRSITGAMVDRHPFGGFKMSGIGSKTGGPDYLLQFLEPRTITENSIRRGFAPVEA